jgi:putative tryptophan/tyrosine transport system substrate-binding protein
VTRRYFGQQLLRGLPLLPALVRQCYGMFASGKALVVGPSANAAYQDTLNALTERLGTSGVETRLVDVQDESVLSQIEQARLWSAQVLVAVGLDAIDIANRSAWRGPVVSSMTLRIPPGIPNLVSSVLMDVPLSIVLNTLRACFPGKMKLGVLLNPGSGKDPAAVRSDCTHAGYMPVIAECPDPAALVQGLLSLRNAGVDFALAFADSSLYNAATIKPLVITSIEQRIPLVGFSASFVRAGAAVGVYADLKEIGRQTADACLRVIGGVRGAEVENARSVRVGVNIRVAHLIGLSIRSNATPEMVLFK